LRHLAGRGALAAALLLGLVLLMPALAAAHQRLLGTEPARDSVVTTVPRELRLSFDEPVEVAFTRIDLAGPDGNAVALGTPRLHADSATVLVVPIEGRLQPGAYSVQWASSSRDGHPVRGEYGFTIADDAAGLEPLHEPHGGEYGAGVTAPGQADPPAAHHPPPSAAMFQADSPAYVLVRWANYIALLGVIGAVIFRLLVLGILQRRRFPGHGEVIRRAARRAAGAGLVFAGLALAAGLARLYAQSLAMHGPDFVLDTGRLTLMLQRTVWGWGWLLQAGAALLALVAFAAARRGWTDDGRVHPAWGVAAIAAVALAVTPALSGHAAAMTGTIGTVAKVTDALHVLAAAGWLGSLLLLMIAGVPAALTGEPGRRCDDVAHLVRAFSPAALLFAGILVATGVVAVFIHSSSLEALLGSRYGMLLLLKLGAFALVLAIGAYNFLRVQPALGSDPATRRLQTSATAELAMAALVLLLTAVLVATARPYDEPVAAAAVLQQPGS
jgi:putative copper export protein/methionine-rich copper-binding protein CopC